MILFESVFQNGALPVYGFILLLAVSLVSGALFAFFACFKAGYSRSFPVCVALLPMAVGVVIALVNGNLGVGVAIAGAFSLVRFRSAPGSAKELIVIFMAMGGGLAFGTGYLGYGVCFLLLAGLILFGVARVANFRDRISRERTLLVTIPEALDYSEVFTDILEEFTVKSSLERVKSVNMGSMFRLTYRVTLRDTAAEKAFLDTLRTRNGNLEIVLSRAPEPDNIL